jgi:dienelactone hydrolase
VKSRPVLGSLALVLGAAILLLAGRGITETTVVKDATPMTVLVPDGAMVGATPGIVVVHGFAGSRRLMRSFALSVARAGFVVAVPDLPGHGSNPAPLAREGDALAAEVARARAVLLDRPEVDPGRIGLLGHSLGSGAVLADAIAHPDAVRAVVAVSPTDAPVDDVRPDDLLLLAGALEARFVANARVLLERAGGVQGLPGDGDARALIVVPRVEHVSILFSGVAQGHARDWFAAALDHRPTPLRRVEPLWGWLLATLGLLLLWQQVAGGVVTPTLPGESRSGAFTTLLAGSAAATASLAIIGRASDVAGSTGVLVAGELGLWFLMAGLVWLRFGVRPARPDGRDAGWAPLAGLLVLLLLWVAGRAWLTWWPTGPRTALVLVLSLLVFPFVLAAMTMLQGRRGLRALGAWALTAGVVLMALGAAAWAVPGLGFLILLLPIVPLVLGLMFAIGTGVDRPWSIAPAGSLLLGWLLAVVFPLA